MLAILVSLRCLFELKVRVGEWTSRLNIGGAGGVVGTDRAGFSCGSWGAGHRARCHGRAGGGDRFPDRGSSAHPVPACWRCARRAVETFDAHWPSGATSGSRSSASSARSRSGAGGWKTSCGSRSPRSGSEPRRKPAIGPAVVIKPDGSRAGPRSRRSPRRSASAPRRSASGRSRSSGGARQRPPAMASPPRPIAFMLPPLDLLDPLPPEKEREIKGDFQAGATVLKETLAEFGIEAEVTNVERGPGGHALRAAAGAGRAGGADRRAEQQHRAGHEGQERPRAGADSRQGRGGHRGAELEDHAWCTCARSWRATPGRPARRRCRWRWARTWAGARSWPTWPTCRTC